MSNQQNRLETLIGAVVLGIAAVFLVWLLSAADFKRSSSGYILNASFRTADGISAGTDVRMAGVKIGTVRSITLDRESYRAAVQLVINTDLPVPDDSGVAVSQEGLLGGSFVEIIPGGSEFAMKQGDEFLDTQGSVSLISLLLKFVAQDN